GHAGTPQGTMLQHTGYERTQDYDTSTGLNRLSSRQGRPRLYAVRPHDGHRRLSHRYAGSHRAALGIALSPWGLWLSPRQWAPPDGGPDRQKSSPVWRGRRHAHGAGLGWQGPLGAYRRRHAS